MIVATCATLHLSLEDKIQDEDAQPMKIYVLSLSCHFSKEAKKCFIFLSPTAEESKDKAGAPSLASSCFYRASKKKKRVFFLFFYIFNHCGGRAFFFDNIQFP